MKIVVIWNFYGEEGEEYRRQFSRELAEAAKSFRGPESKEKLRKISIFKIVTKRYVQ